jgi:DNA (cytosine-5)-methyltransferase 1
MAAGARHHRLGDQGPVDLQPEEGALAEDLARIYAGAVKFKWPEPFLVILRNHMDGQSVDGPLPAVTAGGTHIGLAEPVIMNGRKGNKAQGVSAAPVPTLDTKGGVWLAEIRSCSRSRPPARRAQQTNRCRRSPPAERGQTSDQAAPGTWWLSRSSCRRAAAGCGARNRPANVPTIATDGAHALICALLRLGLRRDLQETSSTPLDTVTSKARFGMVVPVTNSNGGPGPRDMADPSQP